MMGEFDGLYDIDAELNHFNRYYPNLGSNYYSVNKLNKDVSCTKSDLTVYHLNVRSLWANFDIVLNEIDSMNIKFDLLCFTESWVNDNTKDLIAIDNYKSYHSLRADGRRGGGISVFLNDRLKSKLFVDATFNTEIIESLFLEVEISNSRKMLIGVIYRPPNAVHRLFSEKLSEILSLFQFSSYINIAITGDFNYDMFKLNSDTHVQDFTNLMSSYSLLPLISNVTHVTFNSSSLLDNFFLSQPDNCVSGTIVADVSDHFPIFLILKNAKCELLTHNVAPTVAYRVINDHTLNLLGARLYEHDFSAMFNDNDMNIVMENFLASLNDIYNDCCPIKKRTVSYKDTLKPCISNEVKLSMKKRNLMYLQYKNKKNRHESYKRYRNCVTLLIRTSRKNYYSSKYNSYKGNVKATWDLINAVLKPMSNRMNSSIRELLINGNKVSDLKEIVNLASEFFSRVGMNIGNCLPSSATHYRSFLNASLPESFFFDWIREDEVHKSINSLKNKNCPVNCVPVRVYKFVSNIISPILCKIFNKCVTLGIFPDVLKIARVVPIYKGGDELQLTNYRPISVLPTLSKVFEKIVHSKLVNYLNLNRVIFDGQYGFRSNRSTADAFVDLSSYIYTELDKGHYVFSLFLDFRKAFDVVDHELLLGRMEHYGVRGICSQFLRSYLANRKHYISIDGISSSLCSVTHGVPQGSVLGPLLFKIFVNDIAYCTDVFKFILFADDSTVLYSFPRQCSATVPEYINGKLNILYDWILANKLAINIDKSKYIIFSFINELKIGPIKLADSCIQQVNSVKFLGVHIDNNLTFNCHIDYIIAKLSKTTGVLFKLNTLLPYFVLQKFVLQDIIT